MHWLRYPESFLSQDYGLHSDESQTDSFNTEQENSLKI